MSSTTNILQKAAKMLTKLLLQKWKKIEKNDFFRLTQIHFYAFANGPQWFPGVLRDPGGLCERKIMFLSAFFQKKIQHLHHPWKCVGRLCRALRHRKSVKKRVFECNLRFFLARTVGVMNDPFHGAKVPSHPQLSTRAFLALNSPIEF